MKKIFTVLYLTIIVYGCKKDSARQADLPLITTSAATSTFKTSTVSGGTITSDGGDIVTQRGVCWGINHNPDTSNAHTSDGVGTGTFSSNITGLLPSTTYYVRAYAKNSAGIAYGNEISFTTLDYDIYVGGSQMIGAHNVATIWKNGVASSLTDGTQEAYVNCLAVVNTDVYAGGNEHNGSKWVAKVWKNGTEISTLTNGSNDGNALSIFVSGTDVYVGGQDGQVAKTWKNGTATTLTGGTGITSIKVVGSDVYACGDYYSYPASYAQLWKNGVLTELTDRTLFSNANALLVSGTDVYVGGRENMVAKIWKNGVGTSLSDGTKFNMVSALCADGSNIYAGGFELQSPGGISNAKFWKNGTDNTAAYGINSPKISSMYLLGTDLYTCGYEGQDGGAIKIWKNNSISTVIDSSLTTINTIYLK